MPYCNYARTGIQGILNSYFTAGGHRRYDLDALLEFRETGAYIPNLERKTGVAAVYARVSSGDQKGDLERQAAFLQETAERAGFKVRTYFDVGSGLNDARPGLLRLLRDGLNRQFHCLYLTYLDRLARFGTRPIVEAFRVRGIAVRAVQVPEEQSFEQALVADVIALVTSFAGKVHRRRKANHALAVRGKPPCLKETIPAG